MDELFRFVVIRPPQTSDNLAIPLDEPTSELQKALAAATSPAHRRTIAAQFQRLGHVARDLDDIGSHSMVDGVGRALEALPPDADRDAVVAAILERLDSFEAMMVDRGRYRDTFLAFVLAPAVDGPPMRTLARALRAMFAVDRFVNQAVAAPSIARVMAAPILLPAVALSAQANRPWPVGFADLMTVKQHVQRYELGEVARIENVLRGETRTRVRTHAMSSEVETIRERETIRESTEELAVTDRTKLTAEIERSLKETWNVKAGLEVGYGKEPSFFIRANAGFTYDRISEESARYATEVAREITTKAASRLTERIKEVERRKVVESFQDVEEQGFVGGEANVSGVYQFVDKVYRCRIYAYDKRWLLDFVVPEPGAFLLNAGPSAQPGTSRPPEPLTTDGTPTAPLLLPTANLEQRLLDDGTENPFYYAKFVARYGVGGVEPPPPMTIHVSRAYALDAAGTDGAGLLRAENIEIPDGYRAKHVMSTGMFNGAKDSQFAIFAGDVALHSLKDPRGDGEGLERTGGPFYQVLALGTEGEDRAKDTLGEIGTSLPLSILPVSQNNANDLPTNMVLNVVITCVAREDVIAAWRSHTYDRIQARYQQLLREHEERVAAAEFRDVGRQLGRGPERNRVTERLELKKAALAVLEGSPVTGVDQTTLGAEPWTPAPDVENPTFEDDLARIRFLEQAFEWENMTFSLYPYFWGAAERWRDRLQVIEDDAAFENFLRAGAARVVLAIRPGFVEDVFYYLATGLVWQGSDVPVIGDPRYVSIVDELRQQAGAIEGTPVGTDWELKIPTELIRLRADDALPEWEETTPPAASATRTWHWTEVTRP
jgi:hypothetical protein